MNYIKAIILSAITSSAACAGSYGVGAGPVHSAGSVGVSGIETSVEGASAELSYRHESGFGAALTADLSGYAASGDGDPIAWAGVEARYRKYLSDSDTARPYLTGGAGLGIGRPPVNAAVISLLGEAGYELALGERVALTAALRSRPALFYSGGSPPVQPHHTLGALLSLEFRR